MQSSCEMASAWFGGSCAQQFRGSANILHFRLPDSRDTSVIGQFITTVSGLVLRNNFGSDSGIVPEAVSSWPTDHLGDCPSNKKVRTCSTNGLTAPFASKLSVCSDNSVIANLLTPRPVRPVPIVQSDISRMRLCVLVRVHLTCIDPGVCEFWT